MLVFVRVTDTNEPGACIGPGVETLRVREKAGDEGDDDDVDVRINAKADDKEYQISVQTVGRWVQPGDTEGPYVNAAKQYLHSNRTSELPIVTVGFKGAQLTGAIKIQGLEPGRRMNPLPMPFAPEPAWKPSHSLSSRSTQKRRRSVRESTDSEASVSDYSSSSDSDSSQDKQVLTTQANIWPGIVAVTGSNCHLAGRSWSQVVTPRDACALHVLVITDRPCAMCVLHVLVPSRDQEQWCVLHVLVLCRNQVQRCVLHVLVHVGPGADVCLACTGPMSGPGADVCAACTGPCRTRCRCVCCMYWSHLGTRCSRVLYLPH